MSSPATSSSSGSTPIPSLPNGWSVFNSYPKQSSCSHTGNSSHVRAPPKNTPIHKDECTQCFHTNEFEGGVNVCFNCFNGSCLNLMEAHNSQLENNTHTTKHFTLTNHPVIVNLRKREKPQEQKDESMTDAEPQAITKLAIGKEGGADAIQTPKYLYDVRIFCLACKAEISLPATLSVFDPSIISTQTDITVALKNIAPTLFDAADSNAHLYQSVLHLLVATSSSVPSETGWEETVVPCEHTLTLQQVENPPKLAHKGLATCDHNGCDQKTALWLCLTCGKLGCSRKQMNENKEWVGGNGHAAAHGENCVGHPLVVKMGTLTAEGKGDVYCYACNESVVDTELPKHLQHFGIEINSDMVASEKSTSELNLQLNLNANWNIVRDDDGLENELAFGGGYTGLSNLGNSCYMASVLQVLFNLPAFQRRYFKELKEQHANTCVAKLPADCFACQMYKIAEGMLTHKYVYTPQPEELQQYRQGVLKRQQIKQRRLEAAKAGQTLSEADEKEEAEELKKNKYLQTGVAPRMFKKLIAKDNRDFSSAQQQDAIEYLRYLLEQLKINERKLNGNNAFDPFAPFNFQLQERLECLSCHGVRYTNTKSSEISLPIPVGEPLPPAEPFVEGAVDATGKPKKPPAKQFAPVPLAACWKEWSAPTVVADWRCPVCAKAVNIEKTTAFASFPENLVVVSRRFILENWTPEKLDVDITDFPATLELETYRGTGVKAGEVELPKEEDKKGQKRARKTANDDIVSNLEGMGFGRNACIRAALAVDNASADAAAAWLFAHMEDADINDPIPEEREEATNTQSDEPPAEAVESLTVMGFDVKRCKYALKQTSNNVERAVEWLFSHMDDDIPSEAEQKAAAEEQNAAAAELNAAAASSALDDPSHKGVYRLVSFITHLGKSTGSGHYIAHVLKDGRWVQFNDNKVAYQNNAKIGQGYIYVFRRVPQ